MENRQNVRPSNQIWWQKKTPNTKQNNEHIIWLHTVFSAQLWEGLCGLASNWSVVVFLRCHRDQLLGGFGDVVGALDDLLCDQLDVGRAGAVFRRLLALAMETAGAGREQAQGPSHRLRGRPLRRGVVGENIKWGGMTEANNYCVDYYDYFLIS